MHSLGTSLIWDVIPLMGAFALQWQNVCDSAMAGLMESTFLNSSEYLVGSLKILFFLI